MDIFDSRSPRDDLPEAGMDFLRVSDAASESNETDEVNVFEERDARGVADHEQASRSRSRTWNEDIGHV
jgi:hypothetical protein